MTKETVDFLTVVALILSAIGTLAAVAATLIVARTQKKMNQRQLLIPLWEYMSKLDDIDPGEIKPRKVTETVNTLELVALCCEGGMVDEDVIKRTFSANFIHLYDVVDGLPEMPELRKSGRQLLLDNPSASSFYVKLKRELLDRGSLKKA